MKVLLQVDGKEITVLDQNAVFTEGEQVFITEGNVRVSYKIHAIQKILSVVGDNADVAQLVILGR